MMRRKVKQLFAAGMALAVLATNLTPLSFAAEQPDAEPAAAASGDMYDADAISDFAWDWEYKGHSWSSDYATATFYYRVEKNGHVKSVTVDSEKSETSPTCTKDGEILYTATVHSWDAPDALIRTVTKTVTVPKLEHNYPVEPKSIRFDGLSDLGDKPTAVATYECTRCGQTQTEEVTDLTYVAEKEATCIEDGVGYWVASAGGKTMKSAPVHPRKTGRHDFTEKDADHVTFAFAEDGKTAVATIRCAHCDATTTQDVTCTAEVTTPATCTEWGVTTYTATYGDASASVDKTDIKPLGHDFTDYDFHWVDEETCMEAIAQLSCSRCEGVTETIPAEVTVDRVANCTTTGKETHKASLYIDGELYETLSKEFYPAALGHLYTGATLAWDDNTYMTATASLDCQREDCSHVEKETVNALIIPKVAPTCTETGVDIHRVTYSLEGEEVARLEEEVTVKALGHKFLNYVSDGNATCTKDGTKTAVCERQNCNATDTVNDEGSALGHDFTKKDAAHVTFDFAEDGKTAVATIRCDRCDVTTTENVVCTAEVTTPATCTEKGTTTYTATCGTASETTTRQDVPALGHSFTNYVYNGDATCDGDGTETAKCDRCDVTDTRTAVATAGCDLHTVDGAKVCAVCGKVNGQPKLAAAEANADVNASTIGVHLVVRVGTLPTGQKVITVAFLNNDGQAVRMFGTQKIHVSLAQLKAALGDTEGTGFEHTLTRVNTANGEKQNVGFTVENGTVNFDAAFNGSTACILLVD